MREEVWSSPDSTGSGERGLEVTGYLPELPHQVTARSHLLIWLLASLHLSGLHHPLGTRCSLNKDLKQTPCGCLSVHSLAWLWALGGALSRACSPVPEMTVLNSHSSQFWVVLMHQTSAADSVLRSGEVVLLPPTQGMKQMERMAGKQPWAPACHAATPAACERHPARQDFPPLWR